MTDQSTFKWEPRVGVISLRTYAVQHAQQLNAAMKSLDRQSRTQAVIFSSELTN